MLVLFDQATPLPIRSYLEGHAVRTAFQQGWDKRRVAVVVLGQQQWPHVRPHIRLVVDAVNAATPGSFAEVDVPYPGH
jgi:hypothetical protein